MRTEAVTDCPGAGAIGNEADAVTTAMEREAKLTAPVDLTLPDLGGVLPGPRAGV